VSARLLSLCLSMVVTLLGSVPAAPRPEVDAAAVLHAWDERRAAAWASGHPGGLRPLYVRGSAAGRVDADMLRAWRDRGLRVEGMRMQLLRVDVRRSSRSRLELVVTDRLASGVAVGAGVRVPLPRDAASTRTLTLRKVAGEWRVSSVVGQARPVRTTSSTVRSRNP
jgi:hypothetical protein